MTFEEDGRTFLGTSPEVAAITLDAIGADVLGINCSQGPAELRGLAARMLTVTDKPVMVQANAGLPRVDDDGNTVFDIQAPEYAEAVAGMIEDGVSVVGGCCGTTPAHMAALRTLIDNHTPSPRRRKPSMSATSAQTVVDLPCDGHKIAVIGERINPTGKKRLQQALRDGDLDYVVSQGISQQEQAPTSWTSTWACPRSTRSRSSSRRPSSSRAPRCCRCRSTPPTPQPSRQPCAATPASPSSTRSMANSKSWMRSFRWSPITAPTSSASRSMKAASPIPPKLASPSPSASWPRPPATVSARTASSSTVWS